MPNLTQFDCRNIATLLAAGNMDVTEGLGETWRWIPPETTNRTILIGLGGTGVKTVNHIKRTISKRLDRSWENYVAFLAIDSDRTALEAAERLTPDEWVCVTLPGFAHRRFNPDMCPPTWPRFLDPWQAAQISNELLDNDNRRLKGKLKIHDMDFQTGRAVDVEIVNRLAHSKHMLAPLPYCQGTYEVYVIGSIYGGTGSGGFLEMPALIRRALGNHDNVNIYAMLFLPDTMTGKPVIAADHNFVESLQANGYASLKELNYFQGMYMRPGYPEKWYCNNFANPELEMDAETDFFRIPYLIGTSGGPAEDSLEIARSAVAEFIINRLIHHPVQQDFLVSRALMNRYNRRTNPMHPDREARGEYHEFPKAFGTLGFASTWAPQEIVKAYAAAAACRKAGLEPASIERRAAMIAKGEPFLPFRDRDDLMTARAGTEIAEELLKPVTDFVRSYQIHEFNLLEILQLDNISANDIRSNKYSAALPGIVHAYLSHKTGSAMRDSLDQKLAEAFSKFRKNVKTFVMKEGPMAFRNLYMGIFIPENGFEGIGIRRMLANLLEDRNPETGASNRWMTSGDAKDTITRIYWEICNAPFIRLMTQGRRLADEWLQAVNTCVNVCVNERRREHILGRFHALDQRVAEPARILAEEVRAFGDVLTCMAQGYRAGSEPLETYEAFRRFTDMPTEVNIAALHPETYRYLKYEADRIADTISGVKIRGALVDSFFNDPRAWLYVDESLIHMLPDYIFLRNDDRPVAARRMFDKCMTDTINFDMDISIQRLFDRINPAVSCNAYAHTIVSELDVRCRLLLDANLNGMPVSTCLVYPSDLDPSVSSAIQTEAANRGYYAVPSPDADSISLYRIAAPFEIYRLNRLRLWEQQYLNRKKRVNNLLHGFSPDIRREMTPDSREFYADNSSWFDYPSICPEEDPTQMREGGIPHEGKVRLEIDKLLEKARKLGVLYSEQDDNGLWQYIRVHFDRRRDWHFDVFALTPVDQDCHLPTGRALAEAVAEMNHCPFHTLTRGVRLSGGGVMETPRSTEEWAWKYAKRVLYAHRPMLAEIRETVELMEPWDAVVKEINIEIDRKLLPARLIRIMQSGLIYRDENGVWTNGDTGMILLNLSPDMLKKLQFSNPAEAALVTAGFELFALHHKMNSCGETEYHQLIGDLLPKAQNEIKTNGSALLPTFQQVSGMLNQECALLESYGADLANPENEPTAGFVGKMSALKIPSEMLPEICKFYYCAQMWAQFF